MQIAIPFFFDTFSASQWEPSCILPPYSDIYLSLPIMIIELCILLVISALLAMTCAVKKHAQGHDYLFRNCQWIKGTRLYYK